MVFQDPYASLNPRQSVGESIGEAFYTINIIKDKSEQRHYVADVMKRIGLTPDVMDRYPLSFFGRTTTANMHWSCHCA